jgi:hypothetical protein
MNRDEADRWLATLGGAHDRIAAAMYAIDSHPALGFLRGQGLTGRTAAVATAVAADVDALWAGFGVLGDLLEQARATRTGRRPSDAEWSTLTTLLTGPCVVVDAGGQPTLQPPGGPVTPGSRIRATDFAAIADTRTVAVTRQLDDVNASWTSAARAVAPVTEAMTALTVLVHRDASTSRLAMLASDKLLSRHAVSAEDAHHRFDLLFPGKAHFFHPNPIIRLSKAFETSPKSSSFQ